MEENNVDKKQRIQNNRNKLRMNLCMNLFGQNQTDKSSNMESSLSTSQRLLSQMKSSVISLEASQGLGNSSKEQSKKKSRNQSQNQEKKKLFYDKFTELPNEILGEGASGVVKKFKNKNNPKQIYAVKIIRSNDEEIMMQMKRCFQIQKSVEHEFICKTYELYVDEVKEEIIQTMELIDNYQPLDYVIRSFKKNNGGGGLPLKKVKQIMHSLLKAVEFMHERGVCHRDLKPDNILVKSGDCSKIKVIDFGIAKQYLKRDPDNRFITISMKMMTNTGTLAYKAPEMFTGGCYNESIDMWSLGVICYELMTGSVPFIDEYQLQTIELITNCDLTFDHEIFQGQDDTIIQIKQFLKQLIKKETKVQKRLTAKDCLQLNLLNIEDDKNHLNVSVQIQHDIGQQSPFMAVSQDIQVESRFKDKIRQINMKNKDQWTYDTGISHNQKPKENFKNMFTLQSNMPSLMQRRNNNKNLQLKNLEKQDREESQKEREQFQLDIPKTDNNNTNNKNLENQEEDTNNDKYNLNLQYVPANDWDFKFHNRNNNNRKRNSGIEDYCNLVNSKPIFDIEAFNKEDQIVEDSDENPNNGQGNNILEQRIPNSDQQLPLNGQQNNNNNLRGGTKSLETSLQLQSGQIKILRSTEKKRQLLGITEEDEVTESPNNHQIKHKRNETYSYSTFKNNNILQNQNFNFNNSNFSNSNASSNYCNNSGGDQNLGNFHNQLKNIINSSQESEFQSSKQSNSSYHNKLKNSLDSNSQKQKKMKLKNIKNNLNNIIGPGNENKSYFSNAQRGSLCYTISNNSVTPRDSILSINSKLGKNLVLEENNNLNNIGNIQKVNNNLKLVDNADQEINRKRHSQMVEIQQKLRRFNSCENIKEINYSMGSSDISLQQEKQREFKKFLQQNNSNSNSKNNNSNSGGNNNSNQQNLTSIEMNILQPPNFMETIKQNKTEYILSSLNTQQQISSKQNKDINGEEENDNEDENGFKKLHFDIKLGSSLVNENEGDGGENREKKPDFFASLGLQMNMNNYSDEDDSKNQQNEEPEMKFEIVGLNKRFYDDDD